MNSYIIIILLILFLLFYFFICRHVIFPLNSGSEIWDKRIFNLKEIKDEEYQFVAVIVEPRTTNLIETIQTYMKQLPEYTHIKVFHGNLNGDFIHQNFSDEIKRNKISLCHLNVDNLDILNYSNLLTSIEFWKSIPSENILIFQTDSTTCKNSTFRLEDFFAYDFIGAPLSETINNLIHFYFLPKNVFVNHKNYMNGGLSFRKKSKMIQVLENYPWDGKIPEDVWFCMGLVKIGANLPTKEIARKFSFESEVLEDFIPWGIHKPRKEFEKLTTICPEVKNIPTIPSHTDYRNLFLV